MDPHVNYYVAPNPKRYDVLPFLQLVFTVLLVPKPFRGAVSVGGQLHGDKKCSSRGWQSLEEYVPESDARCLCTCSRLSHNH